MRKLLSVLLCSSILLVGCSTISKTSDSKESVDSTVAQTQSSPSQDSNSADQPQASENTAEATKQQTTSSQASSTSSAAASPNASTSRVPNGPKILGATDTSLTNFNLTENTLYFDEFWDGYVYPRKDLILKWTPLKAPNYLIRVRDLAAFPSGEVFWAYVGDVVDSYTIPGSVFTEGHSYSVEVAATTGTDHFASNYKEWYVNGTTLGNKLMIHTLLPAKFISPSNGGTVTKTDLTISWNAYDWKDFNSQYIVSYWVSLKDLSTNTWVLNFVDPNKGRNSELVSGDNLVSGHSYQFEVEERIGGWNFVPDNRQISDINFSVK
ncbi:hypothetical protein ACHOLT_12845 [Desulfitobacterium sp. Sab5]|uniref:hypothetical protein n=1 Tax=Desulfitobacterium nosdiversum TaxID=3375356 RepID=UPI003CECB183